MMTCIACCVQAFKQALAFWATSDARYAVNALRVLDGWASTNRVLAPALDGNAALEGACEWCMLMLNMAAVGSHSRCCVMSSI